MERTKLCTASHINTIIPSHERKCPISLLLPYPSLPGLFSRTLLPTIGLPIPVLQFDILQTLHLCPIHPSINSMHIQPHKRDRLAFISLIGPIVMASHAAARTEGVRDSARSKFIHSKLRAPILAVFRRQQPERSLDRCRDQQSGFVAVATVALAQHIVWFLGCGFFEVDARFVGDKAAVAGTSIKRDVLL